LSVFQAKMSFGVGFLFSHDLKLAFLSLAHQSYSLKFSCSQQIQRECYSSLSLLHSMI
jgi:hypothetical protein